MRTILILISLLLSAFSFAETSLPQPDIKDLDKADRVNLVSIYKDFLINLENVEEPEPLETSSYQKVLSGFFAYASNGADCIYAGWPSLRARNGYCESPDTAPAYSNYANLTESLGFKDGTPVGFQSCTSDQRMCNPVVFGPVCAPFDTKYNRVRATSNCDKASRSVFPKGFDYSSYIAENVSEDNAAKLKPWFETQFTDLQATAQNVCNDSSKKQSRTAVCRVLEERLGSDFPYHRQEAPAASESSEVNDEEEQAPVTYAKSKKSQSKGKKEVVLSQQKVKNTQPKTEAGMKNLEFKIQELNLGIENLLRSKACTDPSVAKVVNKRYNTIQLVDPKSGEFLSDAASECLKKLKPLLANRTKLLNEYERTFDEVQSLGCEPDDKSKDPNSLINQATDINSIVAEKVCEENPQKWTVSGCGKDFACAIGSSLFYGGPLDKVGEVVGKKLGFGKGCLSSQNNCFAKIASAAADVIWSFLKSLPALAGMAWDGMKWVGKKVYSWMPWVTETEKKMSDANQAAMNSLGENEESTLTKIGNFFSNMWQMLQDYVTKDLMCTEPGWEIERFKSDAQCDAPFVSWKCMTCAGAISGVCNVVGAIGSEFLIGLLTGGSANVVKSGVRSVSLAVKAGSRALLKKQMTTLAGKVVQQTVKVAVKTAKVIKAPILITRSVQRKSVQFLKAQKGKFNGAQAWVGRNVNRIATPVLSKSRVLTNVAELAVEGAGKTGKYIVNTTKKVVTAPFKVPGMAIKVVGRVLDPFKLGEKGFALGFQATNGLIPMANFMRITNYGYDLANMTSDISKATNASKAIDHSIELLNHSSKQMDEWLKAAGKGELTQAEFNQMQEVLDVINKTKVKYAGNTKALDRLNDAEIKFLEKEKKLKEALGEGSIKRRLAYKDEKYAGLEKGKVRNLKTGAESNIESVDVLRKESGDIVLRTKPNDETLLVVDEVDGQFVAYTKSGDQVLISSGNLSKDANKLVHSKLKAKAEDARFVDAQDLFKKGSAPKVSTRIDDVETAEDIKVKSYVEAAKDKVKAKVDKVMAPVNQRLDRSALNTQIAKGKTTDGFVDNVEMQANLDKQLNKVKSDLVTRAGKIEKTADLEKLSKEMVILEDAKKVASDPMKLQIEKYQDEIRHSLKNDETRNQLANINRGPAESGNFGDIKANNVSLYTHSPGKSSEFARAYDAKINIKVDESGAFVRLDKNNISEGVRLVDESENSFIGYNVEGHTIHIKKTAIEEKLRTQISESVSKLNPTTKKEILAKVKTIDKNVVHPPKDPDFMYTKQLAQSEIRVGDDIVRLRKWQAASDNMKENLVDGGAVALKSSKGDTILIENIRERGDYWIGTSGPAKKKVLMPKYLLDSETNKLMARGRNFTKFKRNVKQNLSFITRFTKKSNKIDVDKAFRAKYKYANYYIKYNLSKEAISQLDYTTLEKISDKVYLRALGDEEAEVLYLEENPVSAEEQEKQDTALEEAVANEEEYNFDEIDKKDLEF